MTYPAGGDPPRIFVLGDLRADSWLRSAAHVLEKTGLGPWICHSAPDLLVVAGNIANGPRDYWASALRELAQLLEKHPRFKLHLTPTSAS